MALSHITKVNRLKEAVRKRRPTTAMLHPSAAVWMCGRSTLEQSKTCTCRLPARKHRGWTQGGRSRFWAQQQIFWNNADMTKISHFLNCPALLYFPLVDDICRISVRFHTKGYRNYHKLNFNLQLQKPLSRTRGLCIPWMRSDRNWT